MRDYGFDGGGDRVRENFGLRKKAFNTEPAREKKSFHCLTLILFRRIVCVCFRSSIFDILKIHTHTKRERRE